MTSFAVVRVGESRVAAVLVERRAMSSSGADHLRRRLEDQLLLPVMLVARDEANWLGARVQADFDAKPYLYALMRENDIEWAQLAIASDGDVE